MLEEAGGKASVLEWWEGDGREEKEEERGSRLATDPKENYDVCRSETSSLGVSVPLVCGNVHIHVDLCISYHACFVILTGKSMLCSNLEVLSVDF